MKLKPGSLVPFLILAMLMLALVGSAATDTPVAVHGVTDPPTYQETFYAEADTWVDETAPTLNYGSGSYLRIGHTAGGDYYQTLVRFDLAELPEHAIVTAATLELYSEINQVRTAGPAAPHALDIWADALVGDWEENTVNWDSKPSSYNQGDPPSVYSLGWMSWDVTEIVQGWTTGALNNYGILLRLTPVEKAAFDFQTRATGVGPKLTIHYTIDPCPAPLTGVRITGPLTTTTGVSTAFSTVISPTDATDPTLTWAPVPVSGQGTATAHFSWNEAGQYTVSATAVNCGGSFTATHEVAVNAVRLLDIPPEIHRRAARHLEEVRGSGAAPEWSLAQLDSAARPMYRPDVEGVAYFEFPVVIPATEALAQTEDSSAVEQPAGYIVVSTGEHDYPIAHWASAGRPLTWELEKQAGDDGKSAAKFYKLDTLAYAAEDESGARVATIGTQPLRITGMDPTWLDDPPGVTESEWTPALAMNDDEGADEITGTYVITGPAPPPSLQVSGWDSWDAMKAGYVDSYGILAEVLRRNASEAWTAESAIAQYGQPLFKAETFALPLLWDTTDLTVSGPGIGYVQGRIVPRSGLPPAFEVSVLTSTVGQAIPLTVTIDYQNGVTETVPFVIVEPHRVYLPVVGRGLDSMMAVSISGQPVGAQGVERVQAGPWQYHYVGTDADQCWYTHVPKGESPNTSDCTSGCGATSWAMLLCWVDNQAVPSSGNEYWSGRWGLYRVGGGDAVAPKVWGGPGPKEMTWEIRNDIDTWCWDADSAPTLPWDMDGVGAYISGRSATKVSDKYSAAGIGWDYIMEYARDGIKRGYPGKGTPVIVGTGWLSHYPLAYGYRSRSRTYCIVPKYRWGCVTTYDRQFYVNQGWAQGHGEWVPSDIWYAGRVYPRSAWNNDVGLYRPTARRWFFDYDHNGSGDETLGHFGSTDYDALPVAGDFCRDNVLGDIAFFDPSRRSWTFSCGHDGVISEWIEWGESDGRPVAFDYDSDGFVDDIALFRSSGEWIESRDYVDHTTGFIGSWGQAGDLPIAGDFDRDGYVDDIGRYRPSTQMWYYDYNHNGSTNAVEGPWGEPGDLPVVGDFDKDEDFDDVALFRPSTGMWTYDYDHNGDTDRTRGPWGQPGDLPIAGNFDTK